MGLAYISGALTNAGFNVKILNSEILLAPYTIDIKKKVPEAFFHDREEYVKYYEIFHPVWDILKDTIIKEKPDVIGISVWSGAYRSVINICRVVKSFNPEVIIVLGGIHATIDPYSIMKNQEVDFLVCGEGEIASVKLWTIIKEGKDIYENSKYIKGVWNKLNGNIYNGGKTELIDSCDQLPLPNYEGIINGDIRQSIGGIITARGCPFNCSFCASEVIWTRKVRFRSIDSCIQELEYYRNKFNLTSFRINDDSFCVNKVRVIEFCHKLVKKFSFTWDFGIDANVNSLDEEIIQNLESAGCSSISVGIESVSERIRKNFIDKNIDLEYARKIISYINRTAIDTGVYFMTGFPYETEEELKETIKFMEDIKPSRNMWSIVTPYPGTKLYNYAIEKKVLPEVDPIYLMHHSLKTNMSIIPLDKYEKLLQDILKSSEEIEKKSSSEKNFKKLIKRIMRLWFRLFSDPKTVIKKIINKLLGKVRYGKK